MHLEEEEMGMATGKEAAVLRIAQTLQGIDATTISRKLRVSEKYAGEIIGDLVEDGYLKEDKGLYKVTKAGEVVISPYKVTPGEKWVHA